MKKSLLLAALVVGVVSVIFNPIGAVATHEPADKAAAAADDLDSLGTNQKDLILHERMRVSSTSDLILQTTAECSILTSLHTVGGQTGETDNESDGSFGQVKIWIEIDGKTVPTSQNDAPGTQANPDPDFGKVVFCNRAYQRTVVDREENEDGGPTGPTGPAGDGIDEENDFIRTRTANGFNWMAFDVGKTYDNPSNGNNIVDVKVYAQYDRKTYQQNGSAPGVTGTQSCGNRRPDDDLAAYGKTCADAFVGSRSLIIEPTHASNHEQAQAVAD